MNTEVVVITGGSKGLGRALAKEFISKEWRVIICAKDTGEIEAVAEELGATPFAADVTRETDIKALADFAVSTFGRIDIWINNAGVWLPHAPVEELDIDRVKKIFEVNVFGSMSGSKYALIQMRKQGVGTIVNIVSTSGLTGHPGSSGYAASKWALRGFTESLRAECRGTDVRIISVYPSYMKTSLFDESLPQDIDTYLSPESVAREIVENLDRKDSQEEQVIK